MGESQHPLHAKLIIALTSNISELFVKAQQVLEEQFGPIDLKSKSYPFTFSNYYAKEMGPHLQKQIVSFEKLIDKGMLAQVKLTTNEMEKTFSLPSRQGYQRQMNIDPGYLTNSKLVLASTKNFSHRIYIGSGIFAEITLRYFRERGFEPLEWTYPDYCTPLVRDYLQLVRIHYMRQLRSSDC